MKRRFSSVLSGALFLALTGCQSPTTPPTVEDAQTVWHHVAALNHVDAVRELVSMRKTGGQVSTVQGKKIYTLLYEAKVRYLSPVGKWNAGDVQTIESNYGFEQTEKGWQGPDGTIYTK